MDEEADGDEDQSLLVSGAQRDVSTASRAAHFSITVAQGIGLKKTDIKMRQQREKKRTVPRTLLEYDPIAIVKLITKS